MDQQRREALESELMGIRIALAEAHEARDAQAALAALDAMYAFREKYPDSQVLHMPGEEELSFVLPPEAFQMQAKFYSRCAECSGPIREGEVMYWVKATRKAYCSRCTVRDMLGGR